MRSRLLLLAAALFAFGASLGSGFHFDDYAIFSDPLLRSPWGWLEVWGPGQTRPLTHLTFWLNYQLSGTSPFGYHALNLALHLAAVLLAYECLRRLLPERAALLAAALFAVHPLQAEAVDYVWGRSIVLAALFCFAALLAWIDDRPWAAVAWFAAALLAKEECGAFPLLLLLLDRKRPAALAAMFGLSAAAGAHVLYALSVTPGAPAAFHAGITPGNYLLAEGPVILRYLRLLLVPYGFTVDADMRVPPLGMGLAAWAAIFAIAVLACRTWGGPPGPGPEGTPAPWPAFGRGRPPHHGAPGTWLLAGFLLLLPSSSLIPAADLSADRRMYLPLFAFAAAAGILLSRVKLRAAAPALVAVLTLVSVSRTWVWMSEESLWREAVRRAPEKVRPKIQLARSVRAAEALELLNQARALEPYNAAVAAEMGKVLLDERQPEAALVEFGRALALDPRDAQNLNNRGVALAELGQTAAARADFERALTLDPGLTEARENLQKLPAP